MAVFYVFQGETYKQERSGGYVWSPKVDKAGHRNIGYTTMTHIKKGDFILHNSNGKIMSLSVARTNCFEAQKPDDLLDANTTVDWNKDGYRVNLKYYDFSEPLEVTKYRDWFIENYVECSAFTRIGSGKQQYMCHLADEHAVFLLQKAIQNEKRAGFLRYYLDSVINELLEEKTNEYSNVEMDEINDLILSIEEEVIPRWQGVKEKQKTTISKTRREIPKRDPKVAANALMRSGYICEFNNEDRTFLRPNGKRYTEPHHLIPISKFKDFDYSLDVMENIVSLCSHCHNLIHYGRYEDKIELITKLYYERIEALEKCGLHLSLEQLLSYYK